MYELSYFSNPESHAHGTVIGVVDSDGKLMDKFFSNQDDAFDYIKTELEYDIQYRNFVFNPSDHIKEIYDELSYHDRLMIQKSLIDRYRDQCMHEYFNK